ncbi:MAG: endonuclease/exonuclease/phosphatase family protein [Actinomycetes bacterium]
MTNRRGSGRPVRRRFALAHAVAVTYAAFTLVSLGAWVLVGDAWWTQPVNLTTFWWTVPAVLLAPAAWLLRWPVVAALLAIPALTWVWSYGTAFVPVGDVEVPAADTVRVVSFNTFVGAPDHQHVLDLVAEHDPDVLVLQEVFPDREAALREALAGSHPTQVVVQSEGVGGVAVFSRFPLLGETRVGDASTNSRSTEVVTLDALGTPLQVVPVHLISPCPTCGRSIVERLEFEGEVRRAEMGAVLDALDPDLPAIVAGDLNSTERSEPYRTLASAGFADPQRAAGAGMGFTWPNEGRLGPVIRIDWVLSRGLVPVAAWVGDGGASDHRPVVVDLALARQDGG